MTDQNENNPGKVAGKGKSEGSKITQFKKDQSGNPSGRPKGSKNLYNILDKNLNEKFPIVENGKRKKITKMEAIVKQMVNQSVKGDYKSISQLIALIKPYHPHQTSQTTSDNFPLQKEDEEIIKNIADRFRNQIKGEQYEPTNN